VYEKVSIPSSDIKEPVLTSEPELGCVQLVGVVLISRLRSLLLSTPEGWCFVMPEGECFVMSEGLSPTFVASTLSDIVSFFCERGTPQI